MINQHLKNKVSPLIMQCCLSVIATCGAVAMVLLAGTFSTVTVAAEARPPIGAEMRTMLEEVLALLNSGQLDAARGRLDDLDPATLSPYELSRVEQLWFSLDFRGGNYAGARAHMEAAIASGKAAKRRSISAGDLRCRSAGRSRR